MYTSVSAPLDVASRGPPQAMRTSPSCETYSSAGSRIFTLQSSAVIKRPTKPGQGEDGTGDDEAFSAASGKRPPA